MRELPRTGVEAWIIVNLAGKVKPFAGMVRPQKSGNRPFGYAQGRLCGGRYLCWIPAFAGMTSDSRQ
ncbi:MAG: hypothetical protein DRP66_01160 [Planctomycetota bacterium]|nr:MAG: hypothetical protein DRP66_01160 [Planctomycetota bacterium]